MYSANLQLFVIDIICMLICLCCSQEESDVVSNPCDYDVDYTFDNLTVCLDHIDDVISDTQQYVRSLKHIKIYVPNLSNAHTHNSRSLDHCSNEKNSVKLSCSSNLLRSHVVDIVESS